MSDATQKAYRKKLIRYGMFKAARVVEDLHPYAAVAIKTVANGGKPCEDCGYPLPKHHPSCIARP